MATAVVAESRHDPRIDMVEALDAQLVALARSGAPLRRALARIAGAVVARRSWEPLGFARSSDYARERPGLSGRELHDLAHVDAALAKLPALDAALGSGRLGADPDDGAPGKRAVLRVPAPPQVRSRFGSVKCMLRRVVGEWLPTETCVELVAAEVLSAIRLDARS